MIAAEKPTFSGAYPTIPQGMTEILRQDDAPQSRRENAPV